MKRSTPLLIGIILAVSALAQLGYRDRKGDVSVTAKEFVSERKFIDGTLTFDARGDVRAVSKSRGLDMSAPRMRGTILEATKTQPAQIRSLVAFGAFALDQTRTEVARKSGLKTERLTKIRSVGAVYTAPNADSATVNLQRDVHIIDNADSKDRSRAVDMTGDRGTANLEVSKSGTTVRSAILKGNAKVRVVQVRASASAEAPKVAPSIYNIAADQMEYVVTGRGTEAGATITLTGNLRFDSPGEAAGGEVTGATLAVLTLDAQSEVVSVKLSSTAPKLITSRFRKKKP